MIKNKFICVSKTNYSHFFAKTHRMYRIKMLFRILVLLVFVLVVIIIFCHDHVRSRRPFFSLSNSYPESTSDQICDYYWQSFGREFFFKLNAQYYFFDTSRISLHFISSLRAVQENFGSGGELIVKLALYIETIASPHHQRSDDDVVILDVSLVKLKQMVTDFYDQSWAYFTLDAEIDMKNKYTIVVDEFRGLAKKKLRVQIVTSWSRSSKIELKIKRFKSKRKSNSTMVCSKCVFELKDRPANVKDLTSWIRLNRKLGQSFIEV